MVIWLTGLSGAGKTTISKILLPLVKGRLGSSIHIDGDLIRELFGNNLGYDLNARVLQVKRIQLLAKFISDQDINVIVSALYSNPDLLQWNRENLRGYFEVHVYAPLTVLHQRDSKGLYRDFLNGTRDNVVGHDIPWIKPASPDMFVDTSRESADLLAQRIFFEALAMKYLD